MTAETLIFNSRPWMDLMTRPPSPSSPPPLNVDYAVHMQYLRYPTPPITPPRSSGYQKNPVAPSPTPQRRLQTVIMKVKHGQASPIQEEIESESSSPSSSENICDWIGCGSCFENLESLASHVTQMHAIASPDGLYYCRWSGCQRMERGFNARYKMLVHVRTHTKEKPHQCHVCEKSFSRAENLKIHIRSHSGEKPYTCTYEGCNKSYTNSSDRFKHTRTHSVEKPYVCKVPGCQKRYTDPSSLRKHVKTFKHAMQMIDDRSTGAALPSNQTPSPLAGVRPPLQSQRIPSLDGSPPLMYRHRCDNIEEQRPTYLCIPEPAAGRHHYYNYMAMAEEVCPLKATQFECYYDQESVKAVGYWLNDERRVDVNDDDDNYKAKDMRMTTDVEMPLDLRVNRS